MMYKFTAIMDCENKNGVKGCVIYKGVMEDFVANHDEFIQEITSSLKKHGIINCSNNIVNYQSCSGKTKGVKILYRKAYKGKNLKTN